MGAHGRAWSECLGRAPEEDVGTRSLRVAMRGSSSGSQSRHRSASTAAKIVREPWSRCTPARILSGFPRVKRAAHLRSIRELTEDRPADPPACVAGDHLVAHLDADLGWLETAVEHAAAAAEARSWRRCAARPGGA